MVEALDIALAGEPVRLLADRALHWPRRKRLVIADLHLGKGDVFRTAGIPVPSGGTAHDLQRIGELLRGTGAEELWVLGDFLHGPRHAPVESAWLAFRAAHASVRFAVLRGNHDRQFDARSAEVDEIADGVHDGPFTFRHAPPDAGSGPLDGSAHVLCGHVHPVIRLPVIGAQPLFWLRDGCTVLPAFSRFTGGFRIAPADCAGSVACNGRELVRLSGRPAFAQSEVVQSRKRKGE